MNKKPRGLDRRQSRTLPAFPLKLAGGNVVEADRRKTRDRRRNGFISRQAFFANVTYDDLEPLLALCEQLVLQPGEHLIEPGRENHHLFLLLDGRLGVHIDRIDADGGFPVNPGECMGELSIIDGQLTTAHVVAKEKSLVLAIPEQVLWADFFKNPTIARNFMTLFSRRFRDRNRVMQQALEQKLRLEHLQRELSIAQDIQASMLPRDDPLWSRFPQIDIHADMTPANEVGGDFYDSFALDEQRICLAIGDVSGKGIPAALFMVRTMTLLREEMLRNADLPAAMRALNAKLCRDNDRCMFATLFVGVMDLGSGRFSFVNGGHNHPLFGRRGERFEFLETPPGILVGVSEAARFEMGCLQFENGDLLVMYTDGVTEATTLDDRLFSDQRLQQLLCDAEIRDAAQTVELVKEGVRAFVQDAPASDDLTLLVLRYLGG